MISVVLAFGVAHAAVTREQADHDKRRGAIVLEVGGKVIRVGELEDRVLALHPFEVRPLAEGGTSSLKTYLESTLVPEVLWSLLAREKKLTAEAVTEERALAHATLRETERALGPAHAISEEDVRAFHVANAARYDQPERIQLWRILLSSEEEARGVLERLKKDGTAALFRELAREKSLDKASSLRAGALGFVSPDGQSSEPGLKVDPALPRAASSVKDGEFVPSPVREGEHFAVVWRRGTLKAVRRSASEAAAEIRDALWRRRREEAEQNLLARLRQEHVTDLAEGILGELDIPQPDPLLERDR